MRYPDLTKTVQDLTSLHWEDARATPSSCGSYLKAVSGIGTSAVYYKAPSFDDVHGFFGHECVNEVIAARLMDVLGVPHVRYSLVHARVCINEKEYVTWINTSKSYRHTSESKQSLVRFYEQFSQPDESALAFCDRMGWGTAIRQMMLVDYLIINQDRHGANIEVLHLPDGRRRLAPAFDNGNSLLYSCYDVEDAILEFDPLVDAVGNNFVGSSKLADNLDLIGPDLVDPLHESDRPRLFRGLDGVLPHYHLDKIWQVIWERWCTYAHI